MTSTPLHRRDLLQGLLASLAIGCSVSERERTDRPNDGDQKTGPRPDPHYTDPDVTPPGPVDEEAAMDIAKRIDSFAFDFWGQLGKSAGNLVYSPASIALAFAMVHAGAKGKTAAELAKVFHLDGNLGALHAGFADVLRR